MQIPKYPRKVTLFGQTLDLTSLKHTFEESNIHTPLPQISTHSLASEGLASLLACPPVSLLRLQTHLHLLPVYWCLAWIAKDKASIGQILYARKISFEAMIMIGSQMSSAF